MYYPPNDSHQDVPVTSASSAPMELDRPLLVDSFAVGTSATASFKRQCRAVFTHPIILFAGAVILGLCLYAEENINEAFEQPPNIQHAYTSDFSSSTDEAMKLFMWQDRQCQSIGNRPHDDSCAGPPYLYVTFHGSARIKKHGYMKTIHQVCKFTRDGCSMGAVLLPSKDKYIPKTPRAISIDKTTNELFMVDSYRGDSQVRAYGPCNNELDDRREPLRVVIRGNRNDPGLVHPYGIAISSRSNELYVTTQGTYGVLRYQEKGSMKHRSMFLQKHLDQCTSEESAGCKDVKLPDKSLFDYLTSRQFNSKSITAQGREEIATLNFPNSFAIMNSADVRGIAIDKRGNVFVANKKQGIKVFDMHGYLIHTIVTTKLHLDDTDRGLVPVSIIYDEDNDTLWTGCAHNHALYRFNPITFTLEQVLKFDLNAVQHPTGLQVVGDDMFFISQGTDELMKVQLKEMRMNAKGEHYVDRILTKMPDKGEFIAASDC